MDGGDTSEATTAVGSAISALDRARTKGVTHRNAAARSKSRLMKRLNAMEAK
jgi:small subunit ribosomal protein S20